MRNKGSTITNHLSYYINIFKNINTKKYVSLLYISSNEYISFDEFSGKLTYSDERNKSTTLTLAFDISIDKLTFTEYDDNKYRSYITQNYNRKVYKSISKYLDEEYYFQQSTVEDIYFSADDLRELYEFYYKFTHRQR